FAVVLRVLHVSHADFLSDPNGGHVQRIDDRDEPADTKVREAPIPYRRRGFGGQSPAPVDAGEFESNFNLLPAPNRLRNNPTITDAPATGPLVYSPEAVSVGVLHFPKSHHRALGCFARSWARGVKAHYLRIGLDSCERIQIG